jgi:hypothetical protein
MVWDIREARVGHFVLEDPVWPICLMQMARLLEEYKGAGNVDSPSPHLCKSIAWCRSSRDGRTCFAWAYQLWKIAARATADCMILQHSHTEHDTTSTNNVLHRTILMALATMAIYLLSSAHSKSIGTCTELIQRSATVILHGRKKKHDCSTYPKSPPSLPP